MAQAVQYMAGISFLVLGLSVLLRADDWTGWMRSLEQRGRGTFLSLGCITLMTGSFIVAFHPVWQGIPMILTIIGWIAVAEGAVYLLFPQAMPVVLRAYLKCPKMFLRIGGVITIAIALCLLYAR